jgi:DNA repair protein RecN (Recombination protein N)
MRSARGTQVLCVTHSAQIASLADSHYLIKKTEKDGRAETEVLRLDEEGRIKELSRILGGIEVTEAQRLAAAELYAERKAYQEG